jgi:V8-like Glu-specific endopeptidase
VKLLSALLVLLAGCGGCVSVPPMESMRASALRLQFAESLCSGTAIGPDLILTAQHCYGSPLLFVNGQAVKVTHVGRDKHDTLTLRITGVTFKHWARLGPLPKQGDRIRWWGNPEGNGDIYREGYVSRADKDLLVISAPICHGDSGAGVMNDRGEVVAVVTAMSNQYGCTFELSYPLPTA